MILPETCKYFPKYKFCTWDGYVGAEIGPCCDTGEAMAVEKEWVTGTGDCEELSCHCEFMV